MRMLASIFGRLLCCLGIMITVVGCVIGSVAASSTGTTLPGVTLVIAGAAIYWFASTINCSQCDKRVSHTALKCKHCGANIRH
jgi:hypothetical protein